MALIRCSECGKEISNKASTCPNCGCPANKMNFAYEEPEEKHGRALSIISMIIGTISLCGSVIVVGSYIAPLGLILSIIALACKCDGKGFAFAGILTSGISLILLIMFLGYVGGAN